MRVVEDYTRFVLNDRHLSELLKIMRHGLVAALTELPAETLLSCRDTRGDVGTTIETRREYHRTDERDVLVAAFKRLQEALRTLEEFSKVLSGDLAHQLERLRYESYTLEKAVLQTTRNRHRLEGQQLYVLQDDGSLKTVKVTTGQSDGRMTVVRSTELKPGMKVVTGVRAGAK